MRQLFFIYIFSFVLPFGSQICWVTESGLVLLTGNTGDPSCTDLSRRTSVPRDPCSLQGAALGPETALLDRSFYRQLYPQGETIAMYPAA